MKYRIKEAHLLNPLHAGESCKPSEYMILLNADMVLTIYLVQVKRFGLWWTIKEFADHSDNEYARRCAEELLEKLNESI